MSKSFGRAARVWPQADARRSDKWVAGFRAAVLGLGLCWSWPALGSPNIIVVMTDDQAISSLDYMPKLHALIAEQGITFTNSFVNLPLCAPSRASFFTGQAAHNHGIMANNPLDGGGWESFGKLDETVIIYTSDNGYLFGEHRMIGKSAAYDESIRVPLLMRGPGIPANQTQSQLVDNLDVVATIVQLAQARPGVVLDGRSLLPVIRGPDSPWREAILLEGTVNRFQDPTKRYSGVRTLTRKYVKYDGGFEELFDLSADPHELNNEAENPAYATDLAGLRLLQDTLKSCAGESCGAGSAQ
jgi:arylsulfatase A-like enzyme